jgi:hypothetical protein
MNKILTQMIVALVAIISFVSFGPQATGSVIDLGERHLDARLDGIQASIDFIEMDQGLSFDLTYLNAWDLDGFENNGAVDGSHFGTTPIDGGVHANISWDLSTTGFQMSYVLLKDGSNKSHTGDFLYHLYGVTPDQVFNSMGDQFVTVDDAGIRKITYIAFFGVPGRPVPEGGTSVILLGFALLGIEVSRRVLRLRTR